MENYFKNCLEVRNIQYFAWYLWLYASERYSECVMRLYFVMCRWRRWKNIYIFLYKACYIFPKGETIVWLWGTYTGVETLTTKLHSTASWIGTAIYRLCIPRPYHFAINWKTEAFCREKESRSEVHLCIPFISRVSGTYTSPLSYITR